MKKLSTALAILALFILSTRSSGQRIVISFINP